MARGKRPVPFRTRKLSLSAPMVLPWRRGGRVGRRRTTIPEGAPASVLGPLRSARKGTSGTRSQFEDATIPGVTDLVIRARRAVLPEGVRAAAVHTEGGRITAVTAFDDVPDGAVTLDDGEVLLPGLVDSHVHVNEPGRTEWEGFATATRAAAAGGITTIVDMPLNSLPPTVDVAALEVKRKAAAGQCAVDVAFWGGAIPGNLGELRGLHDAGVVGFKCFMVDSGVPEFPPLLDPTAALREIAS